MEVATLGNNDNKQDCEHTGDHDNNGDTTSDPVEAVNRNNERQGNGEGEGHDNNKETSTGSVEAVEQNNNPGQSSKETEGHDSKRENIKDTAKAPVRGDEERQGRDESGDEAEHPSNNVNMKAGHVKSGEQKPSEEQVCNKEEDHINKKRKDWKTVIKISSIFITIVVVPLLASQYLWQDFKSADTFQNALTYTDDDKEELGLNVEEANKIISSFKYAEYHETTCATCLKVLRSSTNFLMCWVKN